MPTLMNKTTPVIGTAISMSGAAASDRVTDFGRARGHSLTCVADVLSDFQTLSESADALTGFATQAVAAFGDIHWTGFRSQRAGGYTFPGHLLDWIAGL